MTDVDSAVIELQSRIAFQEDSLQALNGIIAEQDAAIVRMQKHIQLLNQKLDDLVDNIGEKGGTPEPPPPHY